MWVHRKICIKRLPLPDDCLYEIGNYLRSQSPYALRNELILELMDAHIETNYLRDSDMLVFGTRNFMFQSVFCNICGDFIMFNNGELEGPICIC
jgi:hypothetical protein